MPTIVRNELSSTNSHITVQISKEEIQQKFNLKFKEFRQKAQIKGFRQGQAPTPFVRRMYGQSILQDVFENLVNDGIREALTGLSVNVLGYPKPVPTEKKYSFGLDKLEDIYESTYEISYLPEFEVKGVSSTDAYDYFVVSDLEEIAQKDLDATLRQTAKHIESTENILENDLVSMNGREMANGEVKEGGYETSFVITPDRITDENLKIQFLAAKAGDTIRVNVRHLDTFKDESAYRKYMLRLMPSDHAEIGDEFECVIEKVSRVEQEERNEDFFKNHFGEEITNEQDALNTLKNLIAPSFTSYTDVIFFREFQDKMLSLNDFPLPDVFLREWIVDDKKGKMSEEEIEMQVSILSSQMRWQAIYKKLKEQFDVFVTDEEIDKQLMAQFSTNFDFKVSEYMLEQMLPRLRKDKKQLENAEQEAEARALIREVKISVNLVEVPITNAELVAKFKDMD